MKRLTATLFALLVAVLVAFSAPPAKAADPYEVTIVFLGLMTYDLPNVTPKVAKVVVPNVSAGFKELGDDKHEVHPHVAYILADINAMPKTDPLNKNFVFGDAKVEGAGGVKYHFTRLKGEQISIADDNGASALTGPLSYTNEGCGSSCPTAANLRALCWLTSMKKVYKKNGVDQEQVKKDKFFDPLPDPYDVAGRVTIQIGRLEAHVVHNDDEAPEAPVWEFATPKDSSNHHNDVSITQAVAQEVYWTFKARETPFILNLISFDNGSRRLAFTPNGGKLLIVIGNTAEKDIGPIDSPSPDTIDPHYSVYHRFVKGNSEGKGRIPYRTDEVCTAYTFDPTLKPSEDALRAAASARKVAKARKAAMMKGQMHLHVSSPASDKPDPSAGGLNCAGNQWP